MYEQERKNIQTGDPIFFSGDGLASAAIKVVSGSDKSHIGMAVVAPLNIILCAESTSLNDGKDGVQVNLLSDRVRDYKGTVSTKNLIYRRNTEFYNLLEQGFAFMRGREYETELMELAFAACGEPILDENFSSVFCSEFYAYFLKLWGCLNEPANSYTPGEVFNATLLKGRLGPERWLKK